MSKWGQAIDGNYLADQVNDMLGQIGYKAATDTSPWADIELTGQRMLLQPRKSWTGSQRITFLIVVPWNPFIKRWGIPCKAAL